MTAATRPRSRYLVLFVLAAGVVTPRADAQSSAWRDVKNECALAFSTPTRNTVEACGVALFQAEPAHPLIQGLGPGVAATGIGGTVLHSFESFPFSNSGRFQNQAALSGAYSLNGFWFTEAKLDITHPAIAPKSYREHSQNDRLEIVPFARTDYRSKLDFYGLGPQPSLRNYVRYREDMSEIGLTISNPLSRWFEFGGEINGQWLSDGPPDNTSIRPIQDVFTNQTVPGIGINTEMIHFQGLIRRPAKSQCFPQLNAPCPKPVDWITGRYFDYSIQYDLYHDIRLGLYSFQRMTIDLRQPFTLRRLRSARSDWFCADNEQNGCQFGQFVMHERFVASFTGNGNAVPLSFQQQLGGTDIAGADTLLGFKDLRFRGPDMLLIQAQYFHPIWNPFHLMLFYDSGEVANHVGAVSASNLRQDWGVGLVFALQNDPVNHAIFRFTVGFGSGEGVQYKPRFAPSFQ
jgi:hypothetical protein